MSQPITDNIAFLNEAKKAVLELADLKAMETEKSAHEKQLKKAVVTERKAVADEISSTLKKRTDEITSSYDKEINKAQEQIKKARSKREKAKNQEMKDRIKEETAELLSQNHELRLSIRTLFQKEHVPSICLSNYYYAMYFPRWFSEFMKFILTIIICFLLIPCGIYFCIPDKKPFYLVIIYFAVVIIFGGLYVFIGNHTKINHLNALKQARLIRDQIHSNRKKINVITHSIKRDKNETLYNLQKFDDEIAQIEQELSTITLKKKEALTSFENVTKNIISDEITNNHKERISSLQSQADDLSAELRELSSAIKTKSIYITDHYEIYLGKEFLIPEKIDHLTTVLANGTASNLSEAISSYKAMEKDSSSNNHS